MEMIKSKIGQLGLVMAAFSIMSAVLSIFNYNIRILAWIDLWGESTGWTIRILMVLVGGALFFVFKSKEEEEA